MQEDWRNIINGYEIPTKTYSDQPYIVKTDDGAWLCVVTTGAGREGQSGQHIVTMRSTDQGRTWSDPVNVEPADGPEASYAVLLKVPKGYPSAGRIFCFYNHNTDNIREVIADEAIFKDGKCRRVDSLGHFVFRYSDDGGKTWSGKRYDIPMRDMDIDRRNPYNGKLKFFWNVGKPFIYNGAAYVSLHKVGGFGEGFFTRSEGVLLKSENLSTEAYPEKLAWETLPDGEYGLRTPAGGGPIAEEQSYVILSDGSFYCVYRTIDGHPTCAYSRDGGRSWNEPKYKSYADGRLMKHPRAANFVWKCENGKYLYWFHNHGGRFIREHPRRASMAYDDRNPVWLCGGVEADSPEGRIIQWSQPEIILYDDDPFIRMSYPDLVEENGCYYVTETQKHIARVHELPAEMLQSLWEQFHDKATVVRDGLILELPKASEFLPGEVVAPRLPDLLGRDSSRADYGTLDHRAGFSIELWVRFDSLKAGQVVLDNRAEDGRGFCLRTTARGTLEIILKDRQTENRWDCDPDMLKAGELHHVAVIIDGGPKIISFIVDGKLCDGSDLRQFGWGRYNPNLRSVNGSESLRIAPEMEGEIRLLRIYARYLRTSEAIGNFKIGQLLIRNLYY